MIHLWRASSVIALLILSITSHADAVPGGIYRFAVPADTEAVSYDGRKALIRNGHAYLGIGIKTTPGTKQATLQTASGEQVHAFEVVAKQYPEQHLTIKNRKMVNPDPESLDRIRAESAKMRSAYGAFDLRPAPTVFKKPVQGITSSPFGHRRVLNGQPRNPHSGLDIAADTGTPIHAPAPGKVVVTGDFYFNGKTVLLDHGQGLVTMYCHMSEIQAEEGEIVETQDVIGLVGATGRVTGPHLHWSVSMNGYRVDPVQAMALLDIEGVETPGP